jgi:hypothetical protein
MQFQFSHYALAVGIGTSAGGTGLLVRSTARCWEHTAVSCEWLAVRSPAPLGQDGLDHS